MATEFPKSRQRKTARSIDAQSDPAALPSTGKGSVDSRRPWAASQNRIDGGRLAQSSQNIVWVTGLQTPSGPRVGLADSCENQMGSFGVRAWIRQHKKANRQKKVCQSKSSRGTRASPHRGDQRRRDGPGDSGLIHQVRSCVSHPAEPNTQLGQQLADVSDCTAAVQVELALLVHQMQHQEETLHALATRAGVRIW